MQKAVSSLQPRSERQPDIGILQQTFVDTGILPQLFNRTNQIVFGRRGTGKSHVFRVLGSDHDEEEGKPSHIYIDLRLLGSAQTMMDPSKSLTVRSVSVFKDLLGAIQNFLLELATDPSQEFPGNALEEVSNFAEVITAVSKEVASRQVATESVAARGSDTTIGGTIGTGGVSLAAKWDSADNTTTTRRTVWDEALRDTLDFSTAAGVLDRCLAALGIDRFLVLIDEWTAIPSEVQPYVAEFTKRTLLTSSRLTVKIASLEYRSDFSLDTGSNSLVGFEIGPDIVANLDLDDYYVYDRHPDHVVASFLDLLFRHLQAELPGDYLEKYRVGGPVGLRMALFTAPDTFVELVRAGEGVVRDFLGIFSKAYFRSSRDGLSKIDIRSVEEAARDWFETDKSANLSDEQREILNRIVSDVIGNKQARCFMLERAHASHRMILSLFDLRLLHLMHRGYSDKENPGLRYNIYGLDYGTYVDLKRTKVQPQAEFELDVGGPSVDRIVPFDDKRSIRRIVLDPTILNL
jgi:hypothetical protein